MSLKGSDGSIWRLLAHLSKPVFKYCFLNLGSHTELSHSTNRPMVCRINWSVCLVRCVRMRTRENRKRRRGCSLCFFFLIVCVLGLASNASHDSHVRTDVIYTPSALHLPVSLLLFSICSGMLRMGRLYASWADAVHVWIFGLSAQRRRSLAAAFMSCLPGFSVSDRPLFIWYI